MDTSQIVSVVLLIFFSGGLCLGFYKSFLKEYIKKQRHKYLTPDGLSGNSEWQTLIENWRSLSKLKSWTPEYSRAEEAYRLKFRKFLQTDLDQPNILHIPIVALTLQRTEIYIERYHTRVGDLDRAKSLIDSKHIRHVMYNSDVPKEVKATIRKIRDVEDFVDDQGVDAAMKRLEEVKSELQAKYESLPTE